MAPNVLKMRGTARKDRHYNHEAPEQIAGDPVQPGTLTGDALVEWHRMVERLTLTGAIERVSEAAIYQCALLFGQIEDTRKRYAAEMAVEERLTVLLARPELTVAETLQISAQLIDAHKLLLSSTTSLRQGHMAMRQYLVEFGLTPASRARVKLPPKSKAIDAEKAKYA